jgi:hypothetical protein
MTPEKEILRAYEFRSSLAERNLRRLAALCQSGARDALSLFDDMELQDMESIERAEREGGE